MGTNFTSVTGKLSKLDKFLIVFNFNGTNEIFNQGFCFKKSEIKKENDIVGIWKKKKI